MKKKMCVDCGKTEWDFLVEFNDDNIIKYYLCYDCYDVRRKENMAVWVRVNWRKHAKAS